MNDILKAALEYLDLGLSIIPIKPRDKKPLIEWKEYQTRLATMEEAYSWFDEHPDRGVGIVCGAVSGGLVVVDVDGSDGLAWFNSHCPKTGVFTKTPKNEFTIHAYYISKDQIRNSKPHPQVDIRGEGGYVVAPPSTHPNGGKYQAVILEGMNGWRELAEFSIGSVMIAGGLDLSGVKASGNVSHEARKEGGRNQALAQICGKFFAMGMTIDDVLEYAIGWNMRNKPPLTEKEVISTVRSIAKTHISNHPNEAGIILASETDPAPIPMRVEKPVDPSILQPGGLMQKIMDYIFTASAASLPLFNLGASIAMVGTLAGQRVMTETGLRTNVYIITLGYSGAGKNAPINCIPALAINSSARNMLGPTELTSAASLLKWLHGDSCHVSLVCLDEFGMVMKGVKNPENLALSETPRILTKLFSGTDRPETKSYADSKQNFTIPYHCLSVYGASTPEEFWGALTEGETANGFLARMLVSQSTAEAPFPKGVIDSLVPSDLQEFISSIWNIQPPIDERRGDIQRVPRPFIVPKSPEAVAIFDPWARKYHQLRNDNRKNGCLSSIYGRAAEHASKLALIHAVSLRGASIVDQVVGPESIEWAIKYVEMCMETMIAGIQDNIAVSEWHKLEQRVIRTIKSLGGSATPREIWRVVKGVHPQMKDAILKSLVAEETLAQAVDTSHRGRPTVRFTFQEQTDNQKGTF